MADMVSLQRTPAEQKEREAEFDKPFEGDVFPLDMFVSQNEIEKLGLSNSVVGDEMILTAKVRVTRVSTNQSDQNGKDEDVTLTLVEGATSPVASERSQAQRIFGG